ncbi:MAG: phosphatidylglycerophosphatase A [Kiritimatiellaeota bacterium]|nr:phosphatidylglycerophosphatase A [Kiritimatiellota bacterium]
MNTCKDSIRLCIGSAFGLGLMPVAPGSFGALLGVAMHLGVVWWVSPFYRMEALLACFVVVCAAHFILTPWAQKYWNDTDPSHFVLDEVAGYLVTAMVLSFLYPPRSVLFSFALDSSRWYCVESAPLWFTMLAGFLTFRVFDIIKLPGARYIDRNWHGAWGVLLDDIVSGVYAAVVVALGAYFLRGVLL